MPKQNNKNVSKKLFVQKISAIKKHPIIVISTIVIAILGALITVDTAGRLIAGYVEDNWLWMHGEQLKLNKIAPLTTTDYVSSVLGTPVSTSKISDNLSSYTYRGRQFWVYTIFDNQTDMNLYVAITACGNFHPVLTNNPGFTPIKLGITKLDSVHISTSAPNWGDIDKEIPKPEDRHYFVPQATAPLGIFERHYLANPGRHQTIYAGFNSICKERPNIAPSLLAKLAADGNSDKLSSNQINEIRSNLSINTFAVTTNFESEELEGILDKNVEIGVSSKGIEILSPPVMPDRKRIEEIRSDFDNP